MMALALRQNRSLQLNRFDIIGDFMFLRQLFISDNKTTYPAKNSAAKVFVEDNFLINADTNIRN